MRPNLKAVPKIETDVELAEDFAADVIQMELQPDRRIDVLEDFHLKEVAFCSQQIANNDRELRTKLRSIADEIKRLQKDQERAKADTAERNAVLSKRKAKAEAYLQA